MVKKILKFGGTSVGSIERIQHVANIIKKEFESGNRIMQSYQPCQEKQMN